MLEHTQFEKRPLERKRVQMVVNLIIEGDETKHPATTVDLSPFGLRLQADTDLAPGQPVGLMLPTEPNSYIRARVVWVGKPDSAQAGQAGFQFLSRFQMPPN